MLDWLTPQAPIGEAAGSPPAVVLVGFAEALSAPEVVWSLVDGGFRVIAFARKGRPCSLRHSRHVICHEICAPESDLQTAMSDLRLLLASLSTSDNGSQRLILPLDDSALFLCSRVDLEGGWRYLGPSGDNANLALDKYLQTEAAKLAGFNVPKTLLVQTAKELLSSSVEGSFPMILKPADCVCVSQGYLCKCRHWVCADLGELKTAVERLPESVALLMQPFIAGTGEGVFGLATPHGILAWSGHRRLRMMNPHGSGSSACISQKVPEDIKIKVEELIKATKWSGLFMVELLRDRTGKAWFVELNGRSWGSMALSRRQGFEYPAWHVKHAIDQESRAGMAEADAQEVVCRNVGREFMHLLFVMRGPKSKAISNWPSLWKTLADVLRIGKGETVYNWRGDDRRVFIADCYYVVRDNLFKTRN